MNIDREKIRAMLNEYLDGELTPPQAEEVSAALAVDAELSREYAELLATRQAMGSLRGAAAPQDMADRIMLAANHHAFPMHERTQAASPFGKFFRVQLFAAAAVVLVAVGMGLYVINTLSKSQDAKTTVAIDYPKSKAIADGASASELGEKFAFARPAAKGVETKPVLAEKLSKSRPVSAGSATRETIDKLEGKVLAAEIAEEKPAEDLTPVISPEPSLAMDDDATGSTGSDVSEYGAPEMAPEDSEENQSVVMAPPVLQAPKPVSTSSESLRSDKKRVNVYGSRMAELPADAVGQVVAKAEAEKPAFAVPAKNEPRVALKETDVSVPAATFTPATPEEPTRCAEPVTVAAADEKASKLECAAVETAKPKSASAPCAPACPAPTDFVACEKMPAIAAAKKDVSKLKEITPAQNQDILIETSDINEAQAKLESYMKSNNIQVVSSQQLPGNVARARREALNMQIQNSGEWADKGPITLQYNIRTSQRQAGQLNADLAKQFPNVRNVQQSTARLASCYDATARRSDFDSRQVVSNTVDSNPILLVITIQQRPAVCAITAPATTAPTSAPASQPATKPAK